MAGLIRSSRELHHAGKSLLHEAAGMGEGEDGLEQGTEEGVTPAPGFHQAAFITRGLQLLALGGRAPRTACQLLPSLRAARDKYQPGKQAAVCSTSCPRPGEHCCNPSPSQHEQCSEDEG